MVMSRQLLDTRMDKMSFEDKAGMVETKDGFIPFDEWYQKKFNEEPSRANIRRRIKNEDAEHNRNDP